MLRITRVSLSIGWYNKIRITLSTVTSAVNIKPLRKRLFSVFSCLSDEPVTEDDSVFATGKNESLIRYENVEYGLKFKPMAAELLEHLPSNFELLSMAFIFDHEFQDSFIVCRKN